VEATLLHPFERVDAVEISRGVIEGARMVNPSIFKDKRLNIVEEDARALLLTSHTQYDVIVSETSDPWMTGVSNLYTREFFQMVRSRLADDGIFGTWLQTRHKTVEDLRIMLRTMQDVFPHFAVFQLAQGDTLLVMSPSPLRLDAAFLKERHAALQAELENINLVSPWSIPARLVLGEETAAAYLRGAPINTDDLPLIEFRTPRSLNIGLKGREVWEALLEHARLEPDLPLEHAAPLDAMQWKVYRAEHMMRYPEALQALDALEAAGMPRDPYLRARLLFRLQRFDEALLEVRSSPRSSRQALLEAGILTFLNRQAELEGLLKDPTAFPQQPANTWEARIESRRLELLERLGDLSTSPQPQPAP
jgi:hypothetical protein